MSNTTASWDYLIVTASNEAQAEAYRSQLELRRRWGVLSMVNQVLVVADPGGQRVGSGGSTVYCLIQIVNQELQRPSGSRDSRQLRNIAEAAFILRRRRILIIHAGGDSRRLPAYGPCGKIFVPVSDAGNTAFGQTLFDRLAAPFLELPPAVEGEGQIVIASGDALILFEPAGLNLAQPGLTALACADTPEQASKHGVFIEGSSGQVKRYLQKPSPPDQIQQGAVSAQGQSLLDIGIMSFDSTMAEALFRAFGLVITEENRLDWPPEIRQLVFSKGADFYREICCALGSEATPEHHRQQARRAGSQWPDQDLDRIYQSLKKVPFNLQVLPHARFLHFGTTRQLITSGIELRQVDQAPADSSAPLLLNNLIRAGGAIEGHHAWVEGCCLSARLNLAGFNAVIGLEIHEPLALPEEACLDVLRGQNRSGQPVWFVRCYGMRDTFKDPFHASATFCGQPMREWLAHADIGPENIWSHAESESQRTLWNARVFPVMPRPGDYRFWLWMFDPAQATREQKKAFRESDRYSAAEILERADQADFFKRRETLRSVRTTPPASPPGQL